MKKIWALSLNDFRNISRDGTLTALFFIVPLVNTVLAYLLATVISDRLPVIIPYHHFIAALITLQLSVIFGFVVAFVWLEEKDEGLLPVLRVTPLTDVAFFTYRLLFPFLAATVTSFILLRFTGLVDLPTLTILQTSVLFGLLAPVITLLLTAFAANKIEGLAFFKFINVALLLPYAAPFLPADGWWRPLLWVFPTHWPLVLMEEPGWGKFVVGLVVCGLYLFMLAYNFRRKIMR